MGHILAIDEGTTSTRAAVLDEGGRTVASASREFDQSFPRPGWVEHDAQQIWRVTREMIGQVLGTTQLTAADIDCVGITDQRETTDRKSTRLNSSHVAISYAVVCLKEINNCFSYIF